MLTGTWNDVIHGVFVLLRIMLEFCFFVGFSWVQFKFILNQFGLPFRINSDRGAFRHLSRGSLNFYSFQGGLSTRRGLKTHEIQRFYWLWGAEPS